MYNFGTIVLIPFPFTDLSSSKVRPALIISKTRKNTEDMIVCFISSKRPKKLTNGEYLLKTSDQYFAQSGLKADSVFRFDKIATLNKKLALGEIGSLHQKTLHSLKKTFLEVFGF